MPDEMMIDLHGSNLVPLGFELRCKEDEEVHLIDSIETLVTWPRQGTFELKLRVWDRARQRALTIDLYALTPRDAPLYRGPGLFSFDDRPTVEERRFMERLGVLAPRA